MVGARKGGCSQGVGAAPGLSLVLLAVEQPHVGEQASAGTPPPAHENRRRSVVVHGRGCHIASAGHVAVSQEGRPFKGGSGCVV